MRRTRQTSAVHILVMAILSAVLCGGAFLVPAAGSAATITVEIIKPVDDQVVFDVGKEYDFEAVAFIEGVELPGGEVTWDWDFGDGSAHSADNPAKHKFMACGKYRVTVTAMYGGASQPLAANSTGPRGTVATQALTGQDTLDTVIGVPGSEGLAAAFQWEARNGSWSGPKFGGEVSDEVCVVLRVSSKALYAASAVWGGGTRFWRTVHGVPIEQYGMVQYFQYEVIGDELWTIAYCNWTTGGDKNGEAVEWTAEVSLEVPPPPGGEAPYTQILPIKGKSWTPNNLVIDSGEPLVIEHHPGETKHTLSWSSTHLEDDAAGVGKIYSALVQIFNLSGGDPIAQETVTRELNKAATYDWVPNLGTPEGPDTYGLYTFKITGEHGAPCADTDKVDMLHIDDVQSRLIWPDPSPPVARVDIDFSLSQASHVVKYNVYDRQLNGVANGELGSFGAGSHTERIEFPIPIPDPGLGTYTIVLKTEQADGSSNRDGEVKPALPKSCSVSFGAAAKYIYRYSGSLTDALVGHAAAGATCQDGWGKGTFVFGWYPGTSDYSAGPGRMHCHFTEDDPLQQEVEHSDLAEAFEWPGPSSAVWQNVLADYISGAAAARFDQFILNRSDFELFDVQDTIRNWDLLGITGPNCAVAAWDITDLEGTVPRPLNPLSLAAGVAAAHVPDALDPPLIYYLRGRRFADGLSECGCAPCRSTRGE